MNFSTKLKALATLMAMPMLAQAATGDVNGDGRADIDDVNLIINKMLGSSTGSYNCDVNGDGNVDVDDMNLVINVLLGRVPQGVTPEDEIFTVEGTTFKMIYVEGGTFQMGGNSGIMDMAEYAPYAYFFGVYQRACLPEHQVTVSSFKIMETEVVQKLFYALMGEAAYPAPDSYYYDSWYKTRNDDLPEQMCSWEMAMEFVSRLSAATGRTFRLPTEAEWEFAARGGNQSQGYIFPGGNNLYEVGNVHTAESYENSYKVPKSFAPNELGIYDMAGNVEEWCCDTEYRLYSDEPQTDPVMAGGNLGDFGSNSNEYRTIRGGHRSSFPFMHFSCTVVGRGAYHMTSRQPGMGLRVVLVD